MKGLPETFGSSKFIILQQTTIEVLNMNYFSKTFDSSKINNYKPIQTKTIKTTRNDPVDLNRFGHEKRLLLSNIQNIIITTKLKLFKTSLKQGGFTAKAKDNGSAGIEKLKSDSFDLLLVDYHFSDMIGEEVLSEMEALMEKKY